MSVILKIQHPFKDGRQVVNIAGYNNKKLGRFLDNNGYITQKLRKGWVCRGLYDKKFIFFLKILHDIERYPWLIYG